ncbi:BON domain-containing protein [Methylomonas sp. LL1]|uniref:BON domain-containing protein n=1 Tax=Methylomonas sp. LL1 TaxID=2785785 RepID=UPI0018C4019B|nr:BON domain-containing protein [Methylomonas sp. LL1]QPK63535.1 BON domain-containing protein [Methylomonas sp. LL1]
MPIRLSLVVFALTAAITMLTSVVHAEQIYLTENSALENTQQNVRDKDNMTLTPEDQNESKADIKITADIRNAAVNDDSLSVNAKNVKIITQNGEVTLRGPVETKAESIKLQQISQKTAGVVRVDNQLEIKAP